MERATVGTSWRPGYATVLVAVLTAVVVGGGGAYALSTAPGAQPADLSLSISGPKSVTVTAGSSAVLWHETVSVRNRGPGRTRAVVLVGAPGRSDNHYNQAGDNDQTSAIGTALNIAHSSSTCVPLGAETDIQGAPSRSGPMACEGPMLASGQSAHFVIAYLSYPCVGNYPMTTAALATSALLDPDASNDRARRTVNIVNSGGCG
jgi:hypothetical protein